MSQHYRKSLIGRRTQKDILKDKKVRKDEDGGDIFEDYWTDSDDDDDESSHHTNSSEKSKEVANTNKTVQYNCDNEEIKTQNKSGKTKSKHPDKLLKSQVIFDYSEASSCSDDDAQAGKVIKETPSSVKDKTSSVKNTTYIHSHAAANANPSSSATTSNSNYVESEPVTVNSPFSFNRSRLIVMSPKQVSKNLVSDFLNHKDLHSKSRFEVLKTMPSLSKTLNKTERFTPKTFRNHSQNSKSSFRLNESSNSQISTPNRDSNTAKQASKSKEHTNVSDVEKHYDEYDAIIMQMMNENEIDSGKHPEEKSENRDTSMLNSQCSVLYSDKKHSSKTAAYEQNNSNEANQRRIINKRIDTDIPEEGFFESAKLTSKNVLSHTSPHNHSASIVKFRKFNFSKSIKEYSRLASSRHDISALNEKTGHNSPLNSSETDKQFEEENISKDDVHETYTKPEKENKKRKDDASKNILTDLVNEIQRSPNKKQKLAHDRNSENEEYELHIGNVSTSLLENISNPGTPNKKQKNKSPDKVYENSVHRSNENKNKRQILRDRNNTNNSLQRNKEAEFSDLEEQECSSSKSPSSKQPGIEHSFISLERHRESEENISEEDMHKDVCSLKNINKQKVAEQIIKGIAGKVHENKDSNKIRSKKSYKNQGKKVVDKGKSRRNVHESHKSPSNKHNSVKDTSYKNNSFETDCSIPPSPKDTFRASLRKSRRTKSYENEAWKSNEENHRSSTKTKNSMKGKNNKSTIHENELNTSNQINNLSDDIPKPEKANEQKNKDVADKVHERIINKRDKDPDKMKISKDGHNKNMHLNKETVTNDQCIDSALKDIPVETDLSIPTSESNKIQSSKKIVEKPKRSKNLHKTNEIPKQKNKDDASKVHELPFIKKNKDLYKMKFSKDTSMHLSNEILTSDKCTESALKDIPLESNLPFSSSPRNHTLRRSKRIDKSYRETGMHENESERMSKKQKISKEIVNEVHENDRADDMSEHLTLHDVSPERNLTLHKLKTSSKDLLRRKNKHSSAELKEIDEKSIADNHVRKSVRQRYAPLAHWRNERLLYRFESGQIKILGIDKGTEEEFALPVALTTKNDIKKHKRNKKKFSIIDTVSDKKVKINLLESFPLTPWETPASSSVSSQYRIKRLFETNNASFGYIEIDGLEEKPTQYMPEEDLQLTVMRGHVEVFIQENTFKVKEKDMFIVPRATAYSLKNILTSKALLSFVVGKFKFIESRKV